ncbi:DUF2062 domain-containing protein [Gramella sp. AN32]|uniref:DUF2062 domain-containing protein n=1 Tax=Christiangramia antarctica TaxID=2058158 RepID=A0ABW5WZ87_9FLAO|nr:DUF2062 domain-containing protein [Gramella sp. AN32]
MENQPIFQTRFAQLNCCVIVPTYNNGSSLQEFLTNLKIYTDSIIVVNDGSTDETEEILKNHPELHHQTHLINKGKGSALRTAFKYAQELGFDYAISIDSDGQHYPDDLNVFLIELEKRKASGPPLLLVGDRNMGQDDIPGKSSKGNRFSNFWYMVVTGEELNDTQSGFRLYPLKIVNSLKLITWKFELEIEVIVKACWKGAEVRNIPIKVLYPEGRVTHFRPFWDIVRIVVLYMWFVLVSFFYIHPRNKYRDFRKKGLRKFWKEDVLKSEEPAYKKAGAIALGVFVGISPFWGLHTLLVFSLAATFRLNKVLAFLFSNISIPPLIPFIIYASYQMGSLITGEGFNWNLKLDHFKSGKDVFEGVWQYVIGSLSLAIISAICLWIVFYFLFSVLNQKRVVKP